MPDWKEFRQHLGGRLTLTMLPRVGAKIDVHEVDEARMLEAIEHVRSLDAVDACVE